MPKRESPRSQDFREPEAAEGNGNGQELDALVDAMLGHLPAPGDTWPKQDRELWMQILGLIFQLIYPEDEQEPQPTNQPGA